MCLQQLCLFVSLCAPRESSQRVPFSNSLSWKAFVVLRWFVWKFKGRIVSKEKDELSQRFYCAKSTSAAKVFMFCYNLQDVNQVRTTCILQDVTPGTYVIEVPERITTSWPGFILFVLFGLKVILFWKQEYLISIQIQGTKLWILFVLFWFLSLRSQLKDEGNTTRRQTQYHVSQGETAVILNIYFLT